MTTTGQQTFAAPTAAKRRFPVGAEIIPGNGVHFRVWAPLRKKVEVVIEGGVFNRDHAECAAIELVPEPEGYFSGAAAAALNGTLYRFRLDGGELFPDPASRFQPLGPHGPSQVIDPTSFLWTDRGWPGSPIEGQVIYEMHIGTFTREGTWEAARALLPLLADTGVTLLELMPVADYSGQFGWGYDGVDFFAPTRLYGEPDDFRRFVDDAHALGLGVLLDVVYNHEGPDGSYLPRYSADYFTKRYQTEWGSAFNFDGKNSVPVREFVLANAAYWMTEFHLDGLRLDATQMIFDSSRDHILAALVRTVRETAHPRTAVVIAENEPQNTKLALPQEQGGYGIDALWNDDFHHSARVAMTGNTRAYYTDYRGTPQELISAAKWGYLYQGQHYAWQQKRRGSSSERMNPDNFILFIQNHDQISNSARGERIHRLTDPGRYRAMTGLLLLMPGIPMLFQGQEFAASAPFLYFADVKGEAGAVMKQGREQFLAQFPALATGPMQKLLDDPADPETFEKSKLDFSDRGCNTQVLALHRDLLRLRKEDPVFRVHRCGGLDGAVLGPEALLLRYFGEAGNDRLLIVNLGRDLDLKPAPEPLLAPPEGKRWVILWSSEDPQYGGNGTAQLETDGEWSIPGHAAVAMKTE